MLESMTIYLIPFGAVSLRVAKGSPMTILDLVPFERRSKDHYTALLNVTNSSSWAR